MRIISFTICIIIIFTNLLLAQSANWEKINPDSTYDVGVIEDSLLFVSTYNKGLEFSSDNGKSWIQKDPSPTSEPLINICINRASNTIFVFSMGDHKIYKSTKEGDLWNASLSINGAIMDLISKNRNVYAISDSGYFYFSTDDGLTWDSSFVSKGIKCIDVCSTGQIFICPKFLSNDEGKTWKTFNRNAYSITIDNKDNILICSYDMFEVSKDFGLSWEGLIVPGTMPYMGYSYNSKVSVDNNNNWYLSGDYIIKSTNNGRSWISLGEPYSKTNKKVKIFGNELYLATTNGLFKFNPLIPNNIGVNYLPLKLRNKWQFLYTIESYGTYQYSLQLEEVVKDTLIKSLRYFKIKEINGSEYFDYENRWVRYSEIDKRIYTWSGDSEAVYMDFNLPDKSTFIQISNFTAITNQAKIIEDSISILNNSLKLKGYLAGSGYAGYHEQEFGENIGPIYFNDSHTFGTGIKYDANSVLVNAIIYDSVNSQIYFSNHYKPEIILSPISKINTDTLKLSFSVDHKYSRFSNNSYFNKNVNFIDTVYMVSYYSTNNSKITNDTVYAENIPRTENYILSSIVDTSLLKNGCNFNYKIVAKDKGIIPEYSSLPDTGYYKCVWDNIVSVNDNGNYKFNFQLKQNYPNPFNPSTKIQYAIGSRQLVTLKVYDMLGREVATLVNEEQKAGNYEVEFNGSNLASGIYFYRLKTGNYISTKKLVLLK